MSPAQIEPTLPESSSVVHSPSTSVSERSVGENRRFADLRGVQWRIDLGILPSSSSSIDDLRRVTANSRRRYAALRRRLLVGLPVPKDESNSPDLVMDNPLSQDPDSVWGRFFRNAELERMVDQDLSLLYPEHGSYFQTPGCQGMLRRILLLWCLRHPEYGYRQGMHELLAPLLYVLHVDVGHLSQMQKLYEDHFTDKFDGFSFHESDLTYNFDFKKFSESMEDEFDSQKSSVKISSLDELDPKIQAIVLLSDAYGAEGELGVVLSEKFMEHDAYSMFDALMNGASGAVAMAEFFSPAALGGSHTGLPPVIEASSAVYHLLSIVDSSLHTHLVELGVEPQYFALRWLRVLYGREFALEDLLIIWDEIFASDNSYLNRSAENDVGSSFGVLSSPRGAFISAIAVSMILYLRSSLLATENATSCLQRLLNFPENINLKKLIAKAKSLQALALDANNSTPLPTHNGAYDWSKSMVVRGHSLSPDSISPRTPLSLVPDSYWEEKWRVLHKAEELKQGSLEKQVSNRKKGWSEKMRFTLSRAESAPSPSKGNSRKKDPKSVRRSLLEDLSRQLGSEEDTEIIVCNEDLGQNHPPSVEVEVDVQDVDDKNFTCTVEERHLGGNAGSEENSFIFSDPPSPSSGANDQENESERSSVASNLSADENDVEPNNVESCRTNPEVSPILVSNSPDDILSKSGQNDDTVGKTATGLKERKLLSGKFQWFWKFGRNGGEGTSEKGASEATKASNGGNNQNNTESPSTADGLNSSVISKGDAMDQNVMVTLRNLGQSMLENIQVIVGHSDLILP
uniref:Rab-GAP TBC domain-containing protein n=1 Tax=Davidia involucrata TaxID=16924 RepID=A0A5B6ZIC0_DAVIN